jgi:hypothetical protein
VRTCGSCSLCCKIMEVPFAGKPDRDQWCKFATPGCGCSIYKDRPTECRDFNCLWLLNEQFGDHWYPKTAKMVLNPKLDGDNAYIAVIVDPACPNRWREEPWFSDIKQLARVGLAGLLGQKWRVLILVKDEKIPIVA